MSRAAIDREASKRRRSRSRGRTGSPPESGKPKPGRVLNKRERQELEEKGVNAGRIVFGKMRARGDLTSTMAVPKKKRIRP